MAEAAGGARLGGPGLAADQHEARQMSSNQPPLSDLFGMMALPRYLNGRAATIYDGSNEVQRNIIAKAVLGL